MNSGSRVEIKESEIANQLRAADGLVAKATWAPKQAAPAPGQLQQARLMNRVQEAPSMSLSESLKLVRKDGSAILPFTEYRVLFWTRRGLQIALAAAEEYRKMVGIDQIGDISSLSNDKKTEIQEKMRTAAAITMFTLARFVEEGLADISSDDGSQRDNVLLPEVNYDDPYKALRCLLFYLSHNISNPRVNNDKALGATVGIFFEKVLEDIAARTETFKFFDQFASTAFHVEGDNFTIEGFERHDTRTASVEFKRKEIWENVGNADAKHFIRRLAKRLACYNVLAQKNVFLELGGLMDPWMGFGKPGTGKSDLIAIMATLLSDLCKARGVPFLFHPLPDNLIDSYQGNSARNMVKWMQALQAVDQIIFASIDDGENMLEERTRQGVSEGVKSVIGVFLRYTEGAYAIRRGNSTIGIMTNLPEQIDAAVRSRVQGRMVIDGFKTVEDALDQSNLWWRKKYGDQEGFVNLKDPKYKYQSAQKALKSAGEAVQTRNEPEHPAMREIYDRVLEDSDRDSHEFIAKWMVATMERYPAFSSRDMRNIHSAVDLRVMDFELPDRWFETATLHEFHDQSYDVQLKMVKELRTANMKGLSFGDILIQETVRYLDNYARIADAQFDREVEERIKQIRVSREVDRRLKLVAGGAK